MEQCEICGSTAIIQVEDEEIEDSELYMCRACYKRMFGDPPISCSMMYT